MNAIILQAIEKALRDVGVALVRSDITAPRGGYEKTYFVRLTVEPEEELL